MQVGAVLFLDAREPFDVEAATDLLAGRVAATPRLRQRLERVPPGCGRPVWVDDDRFDLARHVRQLPCPLPRDRAAVLGVAATIIAAPLDRARPLWSATFVTGLRSDEVAFVVVFHHVMSDGIGGLAVLANLVDGAPAAADPLGFPRPAPRVGPLFVDSLRDRAGSVRRLGATIRALGGTVAALRRTERTTAARSSLLRPTGPGRHFELVQADVERVHEVARSHGATVNDVVLVAIGKALRDLSASRGEAIDRFVMSIPVSSRVTTAAGDLGNHVSVMPIEIRVSDDDGEDLAGVAAATQRAKRSGAPASTALLGPLFRLLARLHLLRWFVDHQHMVHTFVTNLRGPTERFRLGSHEVTEVAAISLITGNVTVAFAVLSYAGTLTVTIVSDPAAVPDVAVLRDALDRHLCSITDLAEAR